MARRTLDVCLITLYQLQCFYGNNIRLGCCNRGDYRLITENYMDMTIALALMAAEAVINDAPLNVIDAMMVTFYRQYIKARLILNSRRYDNAADAVCDLPFCSRLSGKKIAWTQCDRCDRWCHNVCVGRPSSCTADKNNPFLCSIC